MAGEAKVLTVAAVQMVSENGNVEGNLEHATAFVEEAAEKGASLVVLPEFMPNGYIYDSGMMWDTAEREGGPTSTWMKETSSRLGIWLGAGFLEAEGEDFFLSFLVTAPDGGEAGRVRKQTPAFAEASRYATSGRISSERRAFFRNTGCMVGVGGASSQEARFLRPCKRPKAWVRSGPRRPPPRAATPRTVWQEVQTGPPFPGPVCLSFPRAGKWPPFFPSRGRGYPRGRISLRHGSWEKG